MKSKTLIEKQLQKKNNPLLVKTLIAAKKNAKWNEIAQILSRPRRKRINLNLDEINQDSKEGEIIVVPGKVLSEGEIEKKIKIVAFNFSEKAKEKLLSAKCNVSYIIDEIKSNPSAKGIKIIKK
ncbi:MAG: 50S ribosomal protein L18e [Candidatus Diapherotrites archaeon]